MENGAIKPTSSVPPGGYEFTREQNTELASLAKAMQIAGVLWIVYGIASAALFFVTNPNQAASGGQKIGGAVGVILNTLMGIWTMSAASSIDRVVSTTGRDIQNTMAALGNLRRFFATLRVVLLVVVVLGLAAIARYAGS